MKTLRFVAVLFVAVGALIGCESNPPELKSIEFPLKDARYVAYSDGTLKLRVRAVGSDLKGGSAECSLSLVEVKVDPTRTGTYIHLFGASFNESSLVGLWQAGQMDVIVRTPEQKVEWLRSLNAINAPRDVAPPEIQSK